MSDRGHASGEKGTGFTRLAVPALGILVVTFATRWPFRSTFLYHHDSVQFALGLEHFDVRLHQPHPPGYFLYILVGRMVNVAVDDPNLSFVVIAMLATAAAVFLMWRLATRLYDPPSGWIAALLFMFSPLLWFHGEVALTYVVGSAIGLWIAHEAWCVRMEPGHAVWRLGLILALAGGVRQSLAVFLGPLVLWALWERPWRQLGLCAAVCVGGALCWLVPMVHAAGGLSVYQAAVGELTTHTVTRGTVLQLGPGRVPWVASYLVLWTCVGLCGALPFLVQRLASKFRPSSWGPRTRFVAVWIGPVLAFYTFVFLAPANPGYGLVFVPALILVASPGPVDLVRRLTEKVTVRRWVATGLVAFVIAVDIVFFVQVYWAEVAAHDRTLQDVVTALDRHAVPGETLVVAKPYILYSFRHVMYYTRLRAVEVHGVGPGGKRRQQWWGWERRTWITPGFAVPDAVRAVIVLYAPQDDNERRRLEAHGGKALADTEAVPLRVVPVERLREVYPDLFVQP